MKRFFKFWMPVLFWAGFIFCLSSLPGEVFPALFYRQDILYHIFVYTLLALLLNRALKNTESGRISEQPKRAFLVILLCLLYAISDEFHQHFVPGRISSISDVAFDSLGIVLGSIIYR